MKVLILGSNSLLAKKLIEMNLFCEITIWPNQKFVRKDVVSNYEEITSEINIQSFDVIINCIANTNLNEQEKNVYNAYEVNALLPLKLAQSLSPKQLLVHFSTDQMYNSTQNVRSAEEEIQLPLSIYSKSKLLSEDCIKIHPNCLIIRTNFVSGNLQKPGHFVSWAINQHKSNGTVSLFDDYICSSIDTKSLCHIINFLILHNATGILNVGAITGFSKYELCLKLFQGLNLNTELLKKTSINAFNETSRLQRYSNLTMNCDKLTCLYGINIPDLEQVSKNVIEEIKNGDLEYQVSQN